MDGTKKHSPLGSKPLISVITASYNQSRYIEKNILSVAQQNYPNIEHLIIDGGSTDGTIDILNNYGDKVRWISERDDSTEDAINKGFRMSGGDIIGVLNSDDYYLPDTTTMVMEFFKEHPDAKIIYGKAYYVDNDERYLADYPTEPFDFQRLAVSNFICQPSVFMRRDAFSELGGFSETLRFATDLDLWIRAAQRYKIEYLPRFLSVYRWHNEAKNALSVNSLDSAKECLNLIIRHYNWAPLNRVFAYCFNRVAVENAYLKSHRLLSLIFATFLTIKEYLRLNRGIRMADIKLLTPGNMKKLLKGWENKDVLSNY